MTESSLPGLALPRAGSLGAWWLALRPRTLPAALAPIAAATGVAAAEGRARVGLALLCLVTALWLQIAANLANDVFDFERGADRGPRLGPPRAAQLGLLSPTALRRGLSAVLAAAAASGLWLVAVGGWPIALAGALALCAAYAYTGGPWPLAYHGLGDLAVFLFFGLVGVIGAHWIQAGASSPLAVLAALPIGSLATAILAVNNLRDRESDARSRKRTLAVRMREDTARRYAALLLVLPFATLPALVFAGPARPGALVPALLLPEAWRCARGVLGGESGAALNARLARVARLTAAFGVALGFGLALEGWR